MDNEEFKKLCASRKAIHDGKIKYFEELIKEQEKYDPRCYAPKSRINLWKLKTILICPVCKKDLIYDFIKEYHCFDFHYEEGIYSCECGYKYAKRQY